jgi:hypothetical protein
MTITRVNDLSDVTGDHLGCWIDGSQMLTTDFDIQLVETGIHFGFEIDIEDWKELKSQLWVRGNNHEEHAENVFEIAEVVYHWFNQLLPQGYYFHIEEQSLYLMHEDMELIND